MAKYSYRSMEFNSSMDRREFLKISSGVGSMIGAGLILGTPSLWAQEQTKKAPPQPPKTNLNEALKVPKNKYSLPGPFPGCVIEVHNSIAMANDEVNADVVNAMFEKGITNLTGKSLEKSFHLFFEKDDVVGIKVNPVGAGFISTRLEVVDAIIAWLRRGGIPSENILIWDRFDYMLTDAGFTAERFPEIGIEGLQTMDEEAAAANYKDNSRWLTKEGKHVSADNFDKDVYYWVDVEGPKDDMAYLNQHVFNGKYSYFGKLLTKKLTKIINAAVFKNTGNGISMAAKNIGYGSICNTNRLHRPLFFNVCTEVMAFPVLRDKLVLNITDGLRAQYEGGPMAAPKYAYYYNTLFFATDPFALDMICHNLMIKKRKDMGIKVNEHPAYTAYLRLAERLGLGIANPEKINHIRI